MNMRDKEQIRQLPCWSSTIEIDILEGGITNRNYVVTTKIDAKKYVVRLGSDIPVHQIMRFNEIAASKAAHAANLSPAICYTATGVLVMDYVCGSSLTPEQVRQGSTLEHIILLLKKCHNEIPKYLRGASVVFWVFHVIRDYAGSLKDVKSRYVDSLDDLLSAASELERAAGPFDIVFGHNDLLAANIMDDGQRLWLIDWEYGGFNTPLFDLGGIASNNELNEKQERWMLDFYFGKPADESLWRRYQAMKCASLLREALWSMVSEFHSTLDFDYSKYTADNLAKFNRSLEQFRRLRK